MSAPDPLTVKMPLLCDALPAIPVLPISVCNQGGGSGNDAGVVALASFEYAESPVPFVARRR
jgi:hypothetical protein